MLSGFHYVVTDHAGHLIGDLQWPNMAQARNARLNWHGDDREAGAVKIKSGGQTYLVEFDYLTRAWANDIRFYLTTQGQTVPHATAALQSSAKPKHRGQISLEHPFTAKLVRRSRWPRQRFTLEAGDREIGVIQERKWFSLKREMTIELPDQIDQATQLFVFFLACHLLQTQT